MAWSAKTSATQLTSITTEQFFSFPTIATHLSLNPGEEMHCQISADFPGSPTDHLVISVYTTLDDSSETWDIEPYITYVITNTPDPNRGPLIIGGIYAFRIGAKRSGTTDTITSADCSFRKNGVDL